MHKLLVEISTKQRVRVLARCLAGLMSQTSQDWDILVINDSPQYPITENPVTAMFWERISRGRESYLIDGKQISQTHNHNTALFDKRFRGYDYILRLDDDVILSSCAIESMYDYLESHQSTYAVSGLWFENENNSNSLSDRDVPSPDDWDCYDLQGRLIDGVASNWAQRVYHTNNPAVQSKGAMEVEHLYGSCMYRTAQMRRAGGWPEIFSRGVAHGEETDGTYRLFLTGGKLVILPDVTGIHLRSPGGIRANGRAMEESARALDNPKRNGRLADMPGAFDRKIDVGIYSQHGMFVGGGPHLMFDIYDALDKNPDINVYLLGERMGAESKQYIGIKEKNRDEPDRFDVVIEMGDSPDDFKSNAVAKNRVLFTFYPFGKKADLGRFCEVVTLSNFVRREIVDKWKCDSRVIYPITKMKPSKPESLEKEKTILCVGRIDQWKGTLWLAERFAESVLPAMGYTFHIVGATVGSSQQEYIRDVKEFAETTDAVFCHEDVTLDELISHYEKAEFLWAAKGFLVDADGDKREAEHFGLTSIEAMAFNCTPIVYNLGGHTETTPKELRWNTAGELIEITLGVIRDGFALKPNPIFYDADNFANMWSDVVYQANAGGLSINKQSSASVVRNQPVIGVITDSYRKKTGFATVGRPIIDSLVEHGYKVWQYAILDNKPADTGEFDFGFWPMETNDMQGERNLIRFLKTINPDVLFTLYDPGNLHKYLTFGEYSGSLSRDGARLPVVAYFPLEGYPIPETTRHLLMKIQSDKGKAFTYSQSGVNAIREQFGEDFGVGWAHHGSDHANFRPFSKRDRESIRSLVGLDGKFIVMSMGVNKRVKQYDTLIYAAAYLRSIGEDKDILFYVHTEPNNPILQGYPLRWMAEKYGVEDMFLWKPDSFQMRGGSYEGAEYESDTLELAGKIHKPSDAKQRGFLFGHYDIIARFNCADMFLDVSSVEGWNLPLTEAMKCGVPSVTIDDGLVRSEIFGDGALMLKPDFQATWHTGSILHLVSPEKVANVILDIKNDPEKREAMSKSAFACASQYKWEDCTNKIVGAINDIIGGV